MNVETYVRVDGKLQRVYTYEEAAQLAGRTTSALRSLVHRRSAEPAGHVTRNVPVFHPADLGLPKE